MNVSIHYKNCREKYCLICEIKEDSSEIECKMMKYSLDECRKLPEDFRRGSPHGSWSVDIYYTDIHLSLLLKIHQAIAGSVVYLKRNKILTQVAITCNTIATYNLERSMSVLEIINFENNLGCKERLKKKKNGSCRFVLEQKNELIRFLRAE